MSTILIIGYSNFIAGAFVGSSGAGRITVINPSTGGAISTVPDTSRAQVGEAIDAAARAQPA